jgi:phosphoribosylaminoimidazolecarboxamide formyltransferase/IMP cyclohydrolase
LSQDLASANMIHRIDRALLSVTDKTGLVEFARGLAELGIELISTGGTARLLTASGLNVREVSEVTGFPEMLDGRVKTLHPAVHGGLLAIRDNPEHMAAIAHHGIRPIGLVVVNLYRFEEAAAKPGARIAEIVENIDIGGPSMIRSAAKNYRDVAVVVSPNDYAAVLQELRAADASLSAETRWHLAQRAFAATAAYDSAIAATLARAESGQGDAELPAAEVFPPRLSLHLEKLTGLRYGENPHQQAAVYKVAGAVAQGLAGAKQLQGRELSYNNLVDIDAAWELVNEFAEPATAIVKHTNPCGLACAASQAESYVRALACDPVSAYGGVLAFNRVLEEDTATEVAKLFTEAIVAPGFSASALEKLASRRNLRLLELSEPSAGGVMWKQISGGLLLQTKDVRPVTEADLKTATERAPTPEELRALLFAWKAVKHVKSNAIVYARDGQLVGVGAGQMSRVDSVKIGAAKAVLPLAGSVMASDAFFPFPDGIEEAAKTGITAVIQPGGSVRDNEVIAAANHHGLAMVFTGVRHFRH